MKYNKYYRNSASNIKGTTKLNQPEIDYISFYKLNNAYIAYIYRCLHCGTFSITYENDAQNMKFWLFYILFTMQEITCDPLILYNSSVTRASKNGPRLHLKLDLFLLLQE